MHIIKADHSGIFDSSYITRISLSYKPDAVVIMAGFANEDNPVTIGRYKDAEEAKAVIASLFTAITTGESGFTMPDSRLHAEEVIKKDARIKRKGGS